jgi:hypothetical protein
MAIRYTVVATEYAQDRLTTLWVNAAPAERGAISRASNAIDRELRDDADQKGVPAGPSLPGVLTWDHPPLRAYFEVSEPDRLVRIVDFDRLPSSP